MTYREPTECAECGLMLKNHGGRHEGSVYHQQSKRIVALLKTPCMTLDAIAKRLSVTRERVRQIAKDLGMPGGYERMAVCTISHAPNALRENGLFADFEKQIAALGFSLGYVKKPVGNKLYKHLVTVNGWRCLLRLGNFDGHRISIRGSNARGKNFDVVIYRITRLNIWLIVPRNLQPSGSTLFALNPAADGKGQTLNRRHDWLNYLDNWEPLRQPKSAS